VLVATPIGNLADLSPRAVDELRRADVIAAEDTRRTRALLAHADIPSGGRLRAVHARNERGQTAAVVELVRAGARVAYVSDAGTPGISDPGERLVRACVAAGLPVETVPGPSAVLAALAVSGLHTGRFRFEGFLPRKGTARRARLAAVAASDDTVVLFESPRRVVATLAELAAAAGPERPVAVARELTKVFEEVVRGPVGEVARRLAEAGEPRGEHVVVLAGAHAGRVHDDAEVEAAVDRALATGASTRDAATAVAEALGIERRRAYEVATRRRGDAVRGR
jgi:16S rRNA (cytidine1402-2'-O)-methyltransferase